MRGDGDGLGLPSNGPEAALVNRYAIAFLDRHLKVRPQPILEAPSPALSTYAHQP